MPSPADLLRAHAFPELFRDLGWDRAAADLSVPAPGGPLRFRAVAQKRGFVVLHASADRTVLADRRGLRAVQHQLHRAYHEHVAIVTSDEPHKQVWLWAVRQAARVVRHRAHPFFSADPPPAFVDRLGRMAFTLDEEDAASLVDARDRIRAALDVTAELNLFVRKPNLARKSDALARRLATGDESAFHPFVLMHRGYARKLSRRLVRWFGVDPDDAEQIATLGLLHAARKFRPDLGYQFTTYARHWIVQACQRYGPQAAMFVHVPLYVVWPCFRLRLDVLRLSECDAPAAAWDEIRDRIARDDVLAEGWPRYRRALRPRRLPGPNALRDPGPAPDDELARDDDRAAVCAALGRLPRREADVLRMRYGIGGPERTLEEVGAEYGFTKERARQVQQVAQQLLRDLLDDKPARRPRGPG